MRDSYFLLLDNACDSKYFAVALVAGNIEIVKPVQICTFYMFSIHFTWMDTIKIYYVVSTYYSSILHCKNRFYHGHCQRLCVLCC